MKPLLPINKFLTISKVAWRNFVWGDTSADRFPVNLQNCTLTKSTIAWGGGGTSADKFPD